MPSDMPSARGYRAPDRLATALRWILLGSVVAGSLAAAARAEELLLLTELIDAPTAVGVADALASDRRVMVTSIAAIVVAVVATIVLIAWTRRMYRNLVPLGARSLRYGDGWAVGGWFVPFLNLVRPKQVMDDVWRASDPELAPTADWSGVRVAPLLHWWWASWIGSALLWASAGGSSADIDTLRQSSGRALAAGVATVATTVLTLAVVVRLTARQADRAARLGEPAALRAGTRRARVGATWVAVVIAPAVFVAALLAFDGPARATSDERGVLLQDLRRGDCWQAPATGASADFEVIAVEVVPCDVPHDLEVVGIVQHPAAPGAEYPTTNAILAFAFDACTRELTQYAGTTSTPRGLDVTVVWPADDAWTMGERDLICSAFRLDLQRLDATVRDGGA
jgi:hypothetical protein